MTIRALVFDFDGIIIDTESGEFQLWCDLFAQHGCKLTLDQWADAIGRPHGSFDPYAHLEQLGGRPVDRDTLRGIKRTRLRAINEKLPALPGIVEYLHEARRLGLKTAIASSSTREWVAGHLERLGLLDLFACLTCAEDTTEHKPNPAPFLAAVRSLQVAPHEAIAFEDSPNGLAAAKSAGLFTVAVPNPVTQRLDLSAADLKLTSLADLPLLDLIRKVTARFPTQV